MTREELKEHCQKQIEMCEFWAISKGEEPSGKVYEEHKLILEILEQQTCDVAVSRQAVIDMCKKEEDHISKNWQNYHSPSEAKSGFAYIATNIYDLPPVTPTISEKETVEDCISRKSIKQKLQEHHDFFVNAYGGFSNLPRNDKSRVDEITNCIAMVVNEPPVQPKIKTERCKWIKYDYRTICPQNHDINNPYWKIPENRMDALKYCPYCGKEIEVTS